MKKVLVILLMIFLAIGLLAGCGNNDNTIMREVQSKAGQKQTPTVPIKDTIAKGEYDIWGNDFSFHIEWEVNDKPGKLVLYDKEAGIAMAKSKGLLYDSRAGGRIATSKNFLKLTVKITNTFSAPLDATIVGGSIPLIKLLDQNGRKISLEYSTLGDTSYEYNALCFAVLMIGVDNLDENIILQPGASYTLESTKRVAFSFNENADTYEESVKAFNERFLGYGVLISPRLAISDESLEEYRRYFYPESDRNVSVGGCIGMVRNLVLDGKIPVAETPQDNGFRGISVYIYPQD